MNAKEGDMVNWCVGITQDGDGGATAAAAVRACTCPAAEQIGWAGER